MAVLLKNHSLKGKFSTFFYQGSIEPPTDILKFFAQISCWSVQLQRNASSLYPLQKHAPFAALLHPFGPGCQDFNKWDLSLMPVKFYLDPLTFTGVIREKPILSKYISRCHAYAWHAVMHMHDSIQLLTECRFNLKNTTDGDSCK